MIEEKLFNLLQEAVNYCYENDMELINMGMEQASVARIFYYMQTLINTTYTEFTDYNLDCEYNKKYEDLKVTPNFRKGIKVDLLLHERKDKYNIKNLLAVEFKSYKGKKEKLEDGRIKDEVKLEDLTKLYKYKLGVFIKLNKRKAKYILFKNGKKI